jgi:hypothetical protein
MMVHAYNPSTQEAGAGGLQIQGQPELQSNRVSQKQISKQTNKSWGLVGES